MTSLACTLSVDSRGPSAIYLMSDSRVSWQHSGATWDAVQKCHVSRRTADLFAFCGDVVYPPYLISQVVQQLDAGMADGMDALQRHEFVYTAIRSTFARRHSAPSPLGYSILHASRGRTGLASIFSIWRMQYWHSTGRWSNTPLKLDQVHSYLAYIDGTGAPHIRQFSGTFEKTRAKGTSRAAMWGFMDALQSGNDPSTGGPPQIVGLTRQGAGKMFGVVWQGRRYFAGLHVPATGAVEQAEWFNANFERCDPISKRLLKGAKVQPRPAP